MKGSAYKKVSGGGAKTEKGILDEAWIVCLPRGCKRFAKKKLSKYARRKRHDDNTDDYDYHLDPRDYNERNAGNLAEVTIDGKK